jgi:hypothetical protein
MRANATTTQDAALEHLKARLDAVLAPLHLDRAHVYPWWTPLIPQGTMVIADPEQQYRFGRDIAYAYGVQPWMIDPQYNTRAERWRWRWHRLTRPWRWLKRKLRGRSRRLAH